MQGDARASGRVVQIVQLSPAVRKRRGRKKATGTRAPLLTVAVPNARWSVDFVHDRFAQGRRFRIFNVIDD